MPSAPPQPLRQQTLENANVPTNAVPQNHDAINQAYWRDADRRVWSQACARVRVPTRRAWRRLLGNEQTPWVHVRCRLVHYVQHIAFCDEAYMAFSRAVELLDRILFDTSYGGAFLREVAEDPHGDARTRQMRVLAGTVFTLADRLEEIDALALRAVARHIVRAGGRKGDAAKVARQLRTTQVRVLEALRYRAAALPHTDLLLHAVFQECSWRYQELPEGLRRQIRPSHSRALWQGALALQYQAAERPSWVRTPISGVILSPNDHVALACLFVLPVLVRPASAASTLLERVLAPLQHDWLRARVWNATNVVEVARMACEWADYGPWAEDRHGAALTAVPSTVAARAGWRKYCSRHGLVRRVFTPVSRYWRQALVRPQRLRRIDAFLQHLRLPVLGPPPFGGGPGHVAPNDNDGTDPPNHDALRLGAADIARKRSAEVRDGNATVFATCYTPFGPQPFDRASSAPAASTSSALPLFPTIWTPSGLTSPCTVS